MPEVTVTEHRHLDSGKDEVGTPWQIHRMQPIAKAGGPKCAPQHELGSGVLSHVRCANTARPHTPWRQTIEAECCSASRC